MTHKKNCLILKHYLYDIEQVLNAKHKNGLEGQEVRMVEKYDENIGLNVTTD
jgi:hypothetical protein